MYEEVEMAGYTLWLVCQLATVSRKEEHEELDWQAENLVNRQLHHHHQLSANREISHNVRAVQIYISRLNWTKLKSLQKIQ